MGTTQYQRNSNMELLRIFAIFSIVLFHCAYKSGFSFSEPTFSAISIKMLWFCGELGVNLFILITGFYQSRGQFKLDKLAKTILEILFYWVIAVTAGVFLGVFNIDSKTQIIASLFPILFGKWWYATAYVLIYILSPWLNCLIVSLDIKSYTKLLLVTLFLWCFLPTIFGVFGNGPEGLLFYTRLTWLVIMYFVGAYISRFGLRIISTMRSSLFATAISITLLAGSVFAIAFHPNFFNRIGVVEWAYFWPPNTIPMLALSLGIFGIFKHIKIDHNPLINKIASTVFGIYLLHDSILANWLWHDLIGLAAYQSHRGILIVIAIAAITICLVGICVDLIRQQLVKTLIDPLLKSRTCSNLKASLRDSVDKLCSKIADKNIGQK